MKLSGKKGKHVKRRALKKPPETLTGGSRLDSFLDLSFNWGLIFISFTAPFMFVKSAYDFANLPQSAFIQAGVVLLFLIWWFRGFVRNGCAIVRSPLNRPVLAFILWSLVSLTYAHNKYEGFLSWMSWAASALMFFLVINGIREEKKIAHLLTALFASGFLCALLGIAQHLFGFSWVPQVKPPAATFANKNMATHFIVLTLPLCVGLALNAGEKARVWFVAAAVGLMVGFLIYTRTRAGWVAVAAEVLFLTVLIVRERLGNKGVVFWNRRKSLAAGLAAGIVLCMMNLGPGGFKAGLKEILQETATMVEFEEESPLGHSIEAKNVALRVAIWRNTLEMIKDSPWIGWGLGNHKVFYPLYHRRVVEEKAFSETTQLSHVHNDFLQAFSELGLVGMGLLAWLVAAVGVIVFRLTSCRYPDHVRFWTMGIAAGMLGLLVNAFFCFPFQRAVPSFVFMIFIGTLGAFYAGEHGTGNVLGRRWLILCAGLMVSAAWIWLVRFHVLDIRCDRHYMIMAQLERAGQWRGVVSEGEEARHYNPLRTKVLSYVGRAYVETGRFEEGVRALHQVIQAYPYHMNALLNIGVAYGSIGEYEKALEAYRRVLTIKPDYGKVHNNMGNIYMKQKRLDEAMDQFQLAADLDPENAAIYFNIGMANTYTGDYEGAAAAFEKTIQLRPEWALAHKRLGTIYLQFLNKKQEGAAHLRRALELDPGMQDAAQVEKSIDTAEKGNP